MIKFGDTEYFTLLDLRDKLKYQAYSKLDLINLDKLYNEIIIKIAQIEYQYNNDKE